jgi:hypothetical protein
MASCPLPVFLQPGEDTTQVTDNRTIRHHCALPLQPERLQTGLLCALNVGL